MNNFSDSPQLCGQFLSNYRVHARYLSGDLEIIPVQGVGTDAVLYLKSHPADASEIVPVFNQETVRRYENPDDLAMALGEEMGNGGDFVRDKIMARERAKEEKEDYDLTGM